MAIKTNQGNGGKTNWLSIRKGQFAKYSKEPLEGYVEEISTTGSKGYYDYYGGTEKGYITNIVTMKQELPSGGVIHSLGIAIQSENETDFIKIPMYTQKGGLSNYLKNFITYLPNINLSHKIQISTNSQKDERGYYAQQFFIKDIDEDVFYKSKHKFGAEGDIPTPVKKIKSGQEMNDYEAQDNYLYDILTKEIKRFVAFKESNTVEEDTHTPSPSPANTRNAPTPIPTPTPTPTPATALGSEDEDDDIPF